MVDKNKEDKKDGDWQDIDAVECDPEYQDLFDDNVIDFLSKENPSLLEIMKKAGLEVE